MSTNRLAMPRDARRDRSAPSQSDLAARGARLVQPIPWDAGADAGCSRCVVLEKGVAKLRRDAAVREALHAQVVPALREASRELRARVNLTSRNASKPPSSDPPGVPPSIRKPGGQPRSRGQDAGGLLRGADRPSSEGAACARSRGRATPGRRSLGRRQRTRASGALRSPPPSCGPAGCGGLGSPCGHVSEHAMAATQPPEMG